jgi:hypothetical protein
MEEQAQLSSRVRKPCYHISLTLPQSDVRDFGVSDWSELTKDFVERMELSDRQAVAYLHDDASYPDGETRPHVHLVVNRVGDDGRCTSTSWDYYRAQSALRQAEKHLGLTQEKSSWEVDRRRDTPDQVQRRQDASPIVPPTIRTQLQNSIDDAIDRVGSLDGVADFMQNLGVDVRVSDRGWSLKHERVAIQGSKLGRAYSAPAVKQRIAMAQSQPIGDMLRESAEADRQDDQERRADNQQRIQSTDRLGQQIAGQDGDSIDGMTLMGAGVQAAAVAMKAIDAIQNAIADSRDEERKKRLEETLQRMKSLGERTERVESQLTADDDRDRNERIADIADRTQRLEHSGELDRAAHLNTQTEPQNKNEGDRTHTGFERTIGAPEPDPVVESLIGLDDRISSLEGGNSQSQRPQQLQLNREMSFDEQLDAVDALLDNLESRLDALEERVFGVDDAEPQTAPLPEAEPEASPTNTTEGSELADRIANYAQSRASVYGIPQSGTIPTRSLGEIEADFNGDDASISIRDDDYGTKFEAVRIGDRDSWEILTDELNDTERTNLADLPQEPEEYVERANGKAVVRSIGVLAGHEFRKEDGGGVRWTDHVNGVPSDTFDFEISPRADGGRTVIGTRPDSGETVLQATVQDGKTRVTQSDIPTPVVDRLDQQAQGALKRQRERLISRTQSRQSESER